jgi:hypothetical protein
MIGLHGLIVWWTAQVPPQQRPDRDDTDRAGIYDQVAKIVRSPRVSSNNDQIIIAPLETIYFVYRQFAVRWHLLVVIVITT